MKTETKSPFNAKNITALLLATMATGLMFATSDGWTSVNNAQIEPLTKHQQPVNPPVMSEPPKIQLAILLDTSGSMDGLIDQTRNQLWQVVNEFAHSKRNGVTPRLEVAVYEYGNSGLSTQSGYIRQVLNLTNNLDQVSEALFSLTTNGGDEYCGFAIQKSVTELAWSKNDNDIKAIFIAGNEPFTQGPVNYQTAINKAKQAGITVNTIHAGDYATGISSGWQQGAMLAGGNYMSIDHNQQIAHVVAPQDKKIAELNAKLNQTYVPYGSKGEEGAARQQAQDEASNGISLGLLAKRAKSKASALYDNSSWDLVDATESGTADLEALPAAALPPALQEMEVEERKDFVAKKQQERKQLKEEIAELAKERDSFVEEQREAESEEASTVSDALIGAIRQQGEAKAFEFNAE